jgi:hypothetical protein
MWVLSDHTRLPAIPQGHGSATGDRFRELASRLAAATAQLQVLPISPDVRHDSR